MKATLFPLPKARKPKLERLREEYADAIGEGTEQQTPQTPGDKGSGREKATPGRTRRNQSTQTMKTTTYEPYAGTHIASACKEAVAMAMNGRQNVQFSFNGVELLATPDSVPAKLVAEFNAKLEADAKAYRESPKGIAEAQKRTAEILRKQRSVNTALAVLKDIVADHDKLMLWLKSFTEDADDIGVQFTKSRLADELEAAGYAENEHVGQKPEWFNTRDRMARYIIGQAINCLRMGMPPHPVTIGFVEKYFRIK